MIKSCDSDSYSVLLLAVNLRWLWRRHKMHFGPAQEPHLRNYRRLWGILRGFVMGKNTVSESAMAQRKQALSHPRKIVSLCEYDWEDRSRQGPLCCEKVCDMVLQRGKKQQCIAMNQPNVFTVALKKYIWMVRLSITAEQLHTMSGTMPNSQSPKCCVIFKLSQKEIYFKFRPGLWMKLNHSTRFSAQMINVL